MAYSRLSEKKTIDTSLAGTIQANLTILANAQQQVYAEDEARFTRAILEDNLSLADQMTYRKDQLKRARDADITERTRIRGEIATLKDLIEQNDLKNTYLDQLASQNTGVQSIDATLSWLNDQLVRTTDPKIRDALRGYINSTQQQQQTLQKTTLEQQTTFAANDKTDSIIEGQVNKINAARTKAILAGDDNYVSALDLQLQTLKKARTEASVVRSLIDISVAAIAGQSAIVQLNKFNDAINSGDTSTPITIGATRYDNARSFWESKRADYLNDHSTNGFFPRYQDELNNQIDYRVSKGIFRTDTLGDIKTVYEQLKTRPELTSYADKISQDQQATLGAAAQKRADQVLNQFTTNLDAQQAVRELSNIQSAYGVDMTTNYQKVVLKASQVKDEQINSILSATRNLMVGNPSLSYEQAFKTAVESGAGTIQSPEQQITKSAPAIVKENLGAAAAGTTIPNAPSVTVPPAETGAFSIPTLADGGLYKPQNSSTVYKYENGELRPFEGAFNNDEFKQATGKSFADVLAIPSLGKTPIGLPISKIDVIPAPTPTATPDQPIIPIKQPAPVQQFDTYQVKSGDTLAKIAQTYYKDAKKYRQIFDANKDVLTNPNLIKPGQRLKIPKE